jgi:hypothetical protein
MSGWVRVGDGIYRVYHVNVPGSRGSGRTNGIRRMIIAPMENRELLACKECGSLRMKLKVRVAYSTFWYVCRKCGCSSASAKSIEDAAKKWNSEMKDAETG